MSGHAGSTPLALDRPDDVSRVREVLDRAGFEGRHVRERLGIAATADLDADRTRVLRYTRDDDALATLIRVFVAGVLVPLDAFRRAVAPMDPAVWAEIGLVALEGNTARRAVVLLPTEGLLVAHDDVLPDGSIRRDHVMGIGESSRTTASMMVRAPARRALDLGTGCGYLAMLTAGESEHVLATDVNARAVAMARFNAMLNRIRNVECAEGHLFDPAAGLRFDRIVSNPPFVVSPQDELVYRDGGLQGDAFCERLLRAIPGHLAEEGFAQVLCNWVRLAGRDWLERLSAWFEGSECDVWIIHATSLDPAEYAQQWLPRGNRVTSGGLAGEFDRWMDYYDRQGIEAIDGGFITMRRRPGGRNWIRVDMDRAVDAPTGEGIRVGFAGRDLLDRLGDGRALLDLRLDCPPELRVSQRLRPAGPAWMVDRADCALGLGPRYEGAFTPIVFHLLTFCRGRLPLSAVLPQVAARLGQEEETIREECLNAVRSLISQGFLRPSDPSGPDAGGSRGDVLP